MSGRSIVYGSWSKSNGDVQVHKILYKLLQMHSLVSATTNRQKIYNKYPNANSMINRSRTSLLNLNILPPNLDGIIIPSLNLIMNPQFCCRQSVSISLFCISIQNPQKVDVPHLPFSCSASLTPCTMLCRKILAVSSACWICMGVSTAVRLWASNCLRASLRAARRIL
jgi:hypothetical protein